jgi:hypothetical protein
MASAASRTSASPSRSRPRDLFDDRRRAGGVGRDAVEAEIGVALDLDAPRRGDAGRDLGRALGRRRQDEVGRRDRGHLDDQVDAVEERPREAGLVLRHAALVRLAPAGKARLGRLAAAARVHRRDELEPGRVGDAVVGARDHHLAALDRLA